ncbi:MAG: molybdate ABC transporter permease subunit, partial [Phycisphaerales bacterium]
MSAFRFKQPSVLPGFGLTMGFTLIYMTLILIIPLIGLILFTAKADFSELWAKAVTD